MLPQTRNKTIYIIYEYPSYQLLGMQHDVFPKAPFQCCLYVCINWELSICCIFKFYQDQTCSIWKFQNMSTFILRATALPRAIKLVKMAQDPRFTFAKLVQSIRITNGKQRDSSNSMALVSVRCKLCMIHSPSLACWRRAALIPKAPRSGVDVAASLNSHVIFMLSPQNDAKTIIIIITIIIIMHYA